MRIGCETQASGRMKCSQKDGQIEALIGNGERQGGWPAALSLPSNYSVLGTEVPPPGHAAARIPFGRYFVLGASCVMDIGESADGGMNGGVARKRQ